MSKSERFELFIENLENNTDELRKFLCKNKDIQFVLTEVTLNGMNLQIYKAYTFTDDIECGTSERHPNNVNVTSVPKVFQVFG